MIIIVILVGEGTWLQVPRLRQLDDDYVRGMTNFLCELRLCVLPIGYDCRGARKLSRYCFLRN